MWMFGQVSVAMKGVRAMKDDGAVKAWGFLCPLLGLVGIIALYVVYWIVIPRYMGDSVKIRDGASDKIVATESSDDYNYPWGRSGVFGDSFGALTCLFSALSFWGVLCSLFYQRKQAEESEDAIAKRQLPLILVKPKSGKLVLVYNSKRAYPTVSIRLNVEEENPSENVALGLVYLMTALIPSDPTFKLVGGIDTSDFFRCKDKFNRTEELNVTERNQAVCFIRSLLAYNQCDRPQILLDRGYTCFLRAYGLLSQKYRVQLDRYDESADKLREILNKLETNEKIDMLDLVRLFGDDKSLPLKISPLHEHMIRRCCTKDEYDEFVRKSS